jgi:hypothetical protein
MNNFPPISVDATRMTMASASDKNPLHHTQKMKKRLAETQTHPGEDIDKVDKPQLKAMFETLGRSALHNFKAVDHSLGLGNILARRVFRSK